jgi:hypothetical protein
VAAESGSPFDAVALDEAEKRFWRGLWDTACEDAVVDLGIDMVEFGPVAAAVVAEEAAEPALNFVLGAGASGAVEDDHLAAAVQWMERHGVDFRVPLAPDLPERGAAARWLQDRRHSLVDGPRKLLRDASPPGFPAPADVDVYERTDPREDEGFGDPLAESLGFASWAATFFIDLPGKDGWRCYCAVEGDEPLAYAAMCVHDSIAVLALASRRARESEGVGQLAVLHRCIEAAAAAGCGAIVVAEAGSEPAVSDRRSLLEAGFVESGRTVLGQVHTRVRL